MILRATHAVLGLMFMLGVFVQYNDPDPIPWMLIYGAAALVCLAAAFRPERLPAWAGWLVAAIAFGWAVAIGRHALGHVPFASMFGAWEMKNTAIEENRETYGLLLIAAWMVVVALTRARTRR